jgi:spermidine synthase
VQILRHRRAGRLVVSEAETTPRFGSDPAAALCGAAVILGFTSIVAQVALTRELLDLFLGNELSIALVLSAWLIGVAAGSALGSIAQSTSDKAALAPALVQLAAGLLLPTAVVAARSVPLRGLASGVAPGISDILLVSLVVLAPICVLIGVQFVLLCRAQPRERPTPYEGQLSQVGLVYALEAIGAIAGGLAFHFYVAQRLGTLQTMVLLGAINWLGAAWLFFSLGKRTAQRAAPIAVLAALGIVFGTVGPTGRQAEMATLQHSPRWRSIQLVQAQPSRYGNLVVARHARQVAFYQSGVLLFTSQDQESNEALAHIALLQHPTPRRVLLIGGGASGVAGEILKHRVERLDYVELDPRLLALARRWLPTKLVAPLAEPRVHIHLGDGRQFVKNTHLRFDVAILALPDPTTASLNRFYTQGFYRELARVMDPDSVLLTTLTSSEAYIGGAMRLATASVHNSLRAVFADTLIVPGERMLLLASNRRGTLSTDWRVLASRLRQRNVRCHFVTPYSLREMLLPFRREMALATLRGQRATRPNGDLTPVAYHYQMALWLEQMSPRAARVFDGMRRLSLWWFLPPILPAILWAALSPRRWSRPVAALLGIAAMGAFGLGGEFIALLVFQAARGYLYHQLGILFALFMAGLAGGAIWATSRTRGAEGWAERWLFVALAAAAALAASLSLAALACLRWETLSMPLVGIFLVVAGFVDGSAFPAAVSAYASHSGPVRAGGLIYAADLAGSALGALVVATIIVPLIGISGASLALALLMLAAAIASTPLLRPA